MRVNLTKFRRLSKSASAKIRNLGHFCAKSLFSQQPHFQDEHHIWVKYFLSKTSPVSLHNGHLDWNNIFRRNTIFFYNIFVGSRLLRCQCHLLAPQSGALRISAYGDFQSQPNPSIHPSTYSFRAFKPFYSDLRQHI